MDGLEKSRRAPKEPSETSIRSRSEIMCPNLLPCIVAGLLGGGQNVCEVLRIRTANRGLGGVAYWHGLDVVDHLSEAWVLHRMSKCREVEAQPLGCCELGLRCR